MSVSLQKPFVGRGYADTVQFQFRQDIRLEVTP